MFCEKCGANLPPNAKFCERCGSAVYSVPKITKAQHKAQHKENKHVEKKKKNRKGLWIGLGVVGVVVWLIVIAIVVKWLFFTDRESEEQLESITQEAFVLGDDVTRDDEKDFFDTFEFEAESDDTVANEPEENNDESADQSTVSESTTQENTELDYILPESDTRYISVSELEGLTAYECRLARNEIYARRGRLFNDPALQAYFNSKSWYKGTIPADSFSESILSQIEKANAKMIADYEEQKGY